MLIGLLLSNGLALFNANFYDALYSALARFAPAYWKSNSPSKKLATRTATLKKIKTKTKVISKRISKRTLRNISANIAAIPAEAIPAVGIGVIIAITAMDLYDACADLKDMDELSKAVGLNADTTDSNKVCGMSIPLQQ